MEALDKIGAVLIGRGEPNYPPLLSHIEDVPLLINASEKAKSLVIEAGTDAVLGARPLRRAIERMIVDPVSRLLACGQIAAGDVVEVEQEAGELRFYRLPRSSDKIVA